MAAGISDDRPYSPEPPGSIRRIQDAPVRKKTCSGWDPSHWVDPVFWTIGILAITALTG